MLMKTFYFYSLATGVIFPGFSYTGDVEHADLNAPVGHAPVADVVDALSQQVDLETGELIDYQPPAPADDAERTWAWDADSRRWIPTLTVQGRKPAMLATLERQMLEHELADQGRALREVVLALLASQAPSAASVDQLQSTNEAIQGLRTTHAAVQAATTHQQLDEVSL